MTGSFPTDATLWQRVLSWVPTWLWWHGLLPHGLVGLGFTAIGWFLHAPSSYILLATAAAGVIHEQGDGDFTVASGGPLNGILDAVAFLPVPLAWWLLAHFGMLLGIRL